MLVKKIVYVLNLVEKILRREMHNKRATNELQISQDKFLLSLEGHDERVVNTRYRYKLEFL